jgi:hypothetical protein
MEVLPFPTWVRYSIVVAIKNGYVIKRDVVHMSMPPTLEAKSYQVMWAFGNHIRVSSVGKHLTTCDSGMATNFEEEFVSRQIDKNLVFAKLEYMGWVEKISKKNYGVLKIVVLFCNCVKVNYTRNNVIVKRDEYGFTIINFTSFIPISNQSFSFPLHVEQMFFSDPKERGWKVVL